MEHPHALPTWDLSPLYGGMDDPLIERDMATDRAQVEDFAARYKGTIAVRGLTAEHLRAALDGYEALTRSVERSKPLFYAYLMHALDNQDARRNALAQRGLAARRERVARLAFFEAELGQIPGHILSALVREEPLAPYRHYLEKQRQQAAYRLSEPEEQILARTEYARKQAFMRLADEVRNQAGYRPVGGEGDEKLTWGEVNHYLTDPDEAVRRAAAESIAERHEANAHIYTFAHNALLGEKSEMDQLRGYESPESERLTADGIAPEIVQTLSDTCVANCDIAADYFRLKRRLLGLEVLADCDIRAPIAKTQVEIPFARAKAAVLEGYARFSPRMAAAAERYFTERRIDAAPAPRKNTGASTEASSRDLPPYIYLNYTNTHWDVLALAHELGHGVHFALAARNHALDYAPGTALSETASTFGQAIVFDHLYAALDSPRAKLELLCEYVEFSLHLVFLFNAEFRFEQQLHQAYRAAGELTTATLRQLWLENKRAVFGDAVTLEAGYSWWGVAHIPRQPFYIYSYVFGELLVQALYAQYQSQGEPFVDGYLELLAAGGSRPPDELVGSLGLDLRDSALWQRGCDQIRQRVQQAESLLDDIE